MTNSRFELWKVSSPVRHDGAVAALKRAFAFQQTGAETRWIFTRGDMTLLTLLVHYISLYF